MLSWLQVWGLVVSLLKFWMKSFNHELRFFCEYSV
jgi:hypothetical protein